MGFPEEVTKKLRKAFRRNPWPSLGERQELARRIGLNLDQVGQWFHREYRQRDIPCKPKTLRDEMPSGSKFRFTNAQRDVMSRHLDQKRFPSTETCQKLAREFGVSKKLVHTWFSNYRPSQASREMQGELQLSSKQRRELMSHFDISFPYPSNGKVASLVKRVNLTKDEIYYWFELERKARTRTVQEYNTEVVIDRKHAKMNIQKDEKKKLIINDESSTDEDEFEEIFNETSNDSSLVAASSDSSNDSSIGLNQFDSNFKQLLNESKLEVLRKIRLEMAAMQNQMRQEMQHALKELRGELVVSNHLQPLDSRMTMNRDMLQTMLHSSSGSPSIPPCHYFQSNNTGSLISGVQNVQPSLGQISASSVSTHQISTPLMPQGFQSHSQPVPIQQPATSFTPVLSPYLNQPVLSGIPSMIAQSAMPSSSLPIQPTTLVQDCATQQPLG